MTEADLDKITKDKLEANEYLAFLEEDFEYKKYVLRETYLSLYGKETAVYDYTYYLFGEHHFSANYHQGVDFQLGEEVYSIADGVVVDCFGLCACPLSSKSAEDVTPKDYYSALVLRTFVATHAGSDFVDVLYLHLDICYLKQGEFVARGQQIGAQSNNYPANGYHTHIEIVPTNKVGANGRPKVHNEITTALYPYEMLEWMIFGPDFEQLAKEAGYSERIVSARDENGKEIEIKYTAKDLFILKIRNELDPDLLEENERGLL